MNDSELTIFETSEGHKVYLKNIFTRLEAKQIRRVIRKYVPFDPITQKPARMTLEDIYQASRDIALLVIVKVILPDGNTATDINAAIDGMTEGDEELLLKKIDETTTSNDLTKKNETISSTNAT